MKLKLRGINLIYNSYKMHDWSGDHILPLVITIFSCPNYCNTYNNLGSIMILNVDLLII